LTKKIQEKIVFPSSQEQADEVAIVKAKLAHYRQSFSTRKVAKEMQEQAKNLKVRFTGFTKG
jgi:hypothetical protein